MKYRVTIANHFPAYFKTKREAEEHKTQYGGKMERKIANNWYEC